MESLESKSNSALGSNWGHKIADFDILPYISFIIAFRVLERGIGKSYVKSLDSQSDLPLTSLMGQTGVIK